MRNRPRGNPPNTERMSVLRRHLCLRPDTLHHPARMGVDRSAPGHLILRINVQTIIPCWRD
jgi:hypothetical protein